MPSDDTKILEFNQNQKSDKAPFIIYGHLQSLTKKIDGCKNNPENSFETKVSEHIPSGFISPFKSIENNHDVYRGKDWIKKLWEHLREHTMNIIDFIKKKNEAINKWTDEIIWNF